MGKAKTAPVTTKRENKAPVEGGVIMEVSSRPTIEGICVTCRHAPRCLFVKATRRPIQHCEEFDDGGSAAKPGNIPALKVDKGINLEQGQAVGLCANCDTRLTCMHREPGVNVQECEDYS